MSDNDRPLISLELNRGSFRIVTPEAVYQINSTSPKQLPEALPLPEPLCSLPEAAPPGEAVREISHNVQQDFFREISEELYSAVGRLTRHLSLSIEDLPHHLSDQDWSKSGEKLETAKYQLEEVVKITEKASMEIMDSADLIQGDLERLRDELAALNSLEFMSLPIMPPVAGESVAAPPAGPGRAELLAKVNELIDFVQTLALTQRPIPAGAADLQPPPPDEPPDPAETPDPVKQAEVVRFELDAVFQTLYEFCTNEAVKDHLKEMWNDQDQAFDKADIENALSELAESVGVEDNFYNFPIPAVLKSLYAATPNEKYKTVLKKMNQTASSIFLDSVLPIEGIREMVEVLTPETLDDLESEDLELEPDATQPEPVDLELAEEETTEPLTGLESRQMADLVGKLEDLAALVEVFSPPMAVSGDYTQIEVQDREAVIDSVTVANNLIKNTMGHLTRIMEALSFQDISGQRIEKILTMISDVQIQLVSLLVSVGSKIRVHQGSPDLAVDLEQTKEIARVEAEKMMEKVAPSNDLLGPGAENRLDQTAVNDLLAQLGF